MLKDLVKLANHLDNIGRTKEADYLDNIIKSAATPGWMAPDRAPAQAEHIANAPEDAGKALLRAMIQMTPVVGQAYSAVAIGDTLYQLDQAYSQGDEAKIAKLEGQLKIEGGFALLSMIPISRIGKAAGVLKVKPETIKKVKVKADKPKAGSSKTKLTDEQAQRLYNEMHYQKSLDDAGFRGIPEKLDDTADFEDLWRRSKSRTPEQKAADDWVVEQANKDVETYQNLNKSLFSDEISQQEFDAMFDALFKD